MMKTPPPSLFVSGLLASFLALGCGDDGPGLSDGSAGADDVGVGDVGVGDVGVGDAGAGDAGAGDVGVGDVGVGDAGAGDAGAGDAGVPPGEQPKPNADNTGPRIAISRTLTPAEALDELRETGRLSGVLIDGTLRLSGSDGCGWVIEDSVIHARLYGVQAYSSLEPFDCPSGERPVFDHVEIVGRAAHAGDGSTSALFYGRDAILRHVDLFGGQDGLKVSSRVEVFASYVHDLDHPEGAHVDAIQIRSGADSLLHWNYFDARIAYGTNIGANGSGGLQTGSLSGAIERIVFRDNWWNGGHYTVRMGGSDEPIDYLFRDNKHGRDFTYGPTTGCEDCPYSGGGVRYDDSNVWEDTGEPVN